MKNAHTISHLASFGLAAVLLILTGFSIGAAVITQQLATNTQLAVSLSDRYEHARYAVGAEESLERKYRLEPSPEVYALHRAAATTLVTILLTIQHDGSTQDQILIKHILSVHTLYLAATRDMFAAVDAHDPVRVERTDHLKVDPSSSRFSPRSIPPPTRTIHRRSPALLRLSRRKIPSLWPPLSCLPVVSCCSVSSEWCYESINADRLNSPTLNVWH